MTVAFLLDVDNTLLDNDGLKAWCDRALRDAVGDDQADRFWELYEETRHATGVVDYPASFARLREETRDDGLVRQTERLVYDAPFPKFLFPRALEVIARLWSIGTVVVLSDGDPVYQPLKIDRSGIAQAARGNVLVYDHKETHLDDVTARFLERHYAHVDDKASLLAATKARLHGRVTTVHVRQGHYADDPPHGVAPDIVVDHIADLETLPAERFGA